jgi:alpha-glucosidase (family GH31 glycosyl hydrolase)
VTNLVRSFIFPLYCALFPNALCCAQPMPPKWALGYHQCRWSYETADRILAVAKGFRSRSIPCDTIWVPAYHHLSVGQPRVDMSVVVRKADIDYMALFRCFTFDPKAFPNPKELCDTLHKMNMHAVFMMYVDTTPHHHSSRDVRYLTRMRVCASVSDPGLKLEKGYSVFDSGQKIDAWVLARDRKPYSGHVWPVRSPHH